MKKVEVEFFITANGNARTVKTIIDMDRISFDLSRSSSGLKKLAESYRFMFPGADKVEIGMTRLIG